jgi:hypothetical protein
MSMMYRIFYGILGAGVVSGGLFALWTRLWSTAPDNFWLFLGLSSALGILFGFANYIFVKWVLRIFVNKFFTLEMVLVGSDPKPLGNVLVSNEIDEMEASMVRITEEFSKLKTSSTRRSSSHGSLRIQQPQRGTSS